MSWDTRPRGRNLKRYKLSPKRMAELYGPPLTGRDKVVAEMQAINEDRIHRTFGDEVHKEEWELEPTPVRA